MKAYTTLLFPILMFVACDYQPITVTSINNCEEVYYEELNAGTFTNVIVIGAFGDETHRFFGKFECVDGKLKRVEGGNKRKWSGHGWKKVN